VPNYAAQRLAAEQPIQGEPNAIDLSIIQHLLRVRQDFDRGDVEDCRDRPARPSSGVIEPGARKAGGHFG
jgi:hypothetical protein